MNFTCEACGCTIAIDPEFYENFHVAVCFSCKETDDLYTILTKTQARSEFLLTDEELADSGLLPSISRKNPHNPRWADMKLYLKKQVRDFAIKKHGSDLCLKEALLNRDEVRSDRKSKQFLKKLKGTWPHLSVFFIHLHSCS